MSNPATGGKLIACGYLRKKSPKGLVGLSLWQRRFFCLYENVLTYSKDKSDVGQNQVSGAIPVREMVSVEPVRKDPCRFEIMISGRIFSLLADSPAEVVDWIAAISKQIAQAKLRSQTDRSDADLDKPVKYWKDAKGVLDDLNSPDRPTVQTFNHSNAFTKIDLSTLASLSSSTMRSAKSGVKIMVVPPSSEELDATALYSIDSSDEAIGAAADDEIDDPAGSERRFKMDDLRLERILSQGAFGDLCLVQHKKNNDLYMMQKIKVSSTTATMAVNALTKMSSLNNPYIMQCLDYEIGQDQAWAIYEYVHGPNLLQYLRSQRRLPEDVARFFLVQIAFAVHYIHKKGSIFRNMDPEHVALDSSGNIVITDFRIALPAIDNTQACRNAEYRTPELIAGRPESAESDWWRLGVLAYELLVGFPPFRDKDPAELDHKIQQCVLRFPPFVSGPAADLMQNLMQVEVNHRLGRGRTGFDALQAHAFFADVKWDLVESRNQPVPEAILEFIQQSRNPIQSNT